jgi:hypothetical protein
MKTFKAFFLGLALVFGLETCLAWTPSDKNYNTNQFQLVYPFVNLKSGVHLTNVVIEGTIIFNGTNFTGGGATLIVTNIEATTIITSNLFSTNIFTTNLFATNIFVTVIEGPGTNEFIYSLNGSGTNISFFGETDFNGPGNTVELETGTQLFGDLFGGTNIQASFVTAAAEPLFPLSRRIVGGANIVITDGGPGGSLIIASSGTNSVDTSTNSLVVTTNEIIYLNLNLAYLTPNKLLATDGADNVTNADVAAADLVFAGNVLGLATANASPGTYGDGTHVAVVTVDSKGRATTVSSTAITGAAPTGAAGGVLSGTYPSPGFGTFSSSTLATALSDETGSGVSVFGTGPTISSPVISSATASTFAGFDSGKVLGSASLASSALAAALTDETGAGLAVFSGAPTLTNTTTKGNGAGTNALYVDQTQLVYSNNINQVIASNGTLYASGPATFNGETNRSLSVSQFIATDSHGGQISTLDGSTLTGTPAFDGVNFTDLVYTTNIVGAANWVFGKAYWTNASANFTAPALTMNNNNRYETMVICVTNSSGSVITATFNGVVSAITGTAPYVQNITNATVCEIHLSHFGVQITNGVAAHL